MRKKKLIRYSQLSLSMLLLTQPTLPVLVQAAEMLPLAATAATDETEIASITREGWKGHVFGDVGGQDKITRENFEITEMADGSVRMISANNRGKISGSTDGIAYFYTDVPESANFEFSAVVDVQRFDANNQVGFGIMLRNSVYENMHGNQYASDDYLAVGAVDQTLKMYTRMNGSLDKTRTFNGAFSHTGTYTLSVKKMGPLLVTSIDGEVINVENYDSAITHVGLFTSRNTEVIYRDINLTVEEESTVTELELITDEMKTDYLVNQTLDTTGLKVIAHHSDGTQTEVPAGEYVVTGFDSGQVGTNTITVYYGNQMKTIDLAITALSVTDLRIIYYPAKTNYYIGDSFVSDGLVVEADYNNGETNRLSTDLYEIEVAEVFTEAGDQTVNIVSKQTPEQQVSFTVTVEETELKDVMISQEPQKTLYFLNEAFNSTGLVVYAEYEDGSRVRLDRSEYTISELDTTTPGTKMLTVTHKGSTTTFDVVVKEKEVTGIVVTAYPKTTYNTREDFDAAGLVVAKEYDNGDLEALTLEEYVVTTPEWSTPGTFELEITPVADGLAAIKLPITVVEEAEVVWDEIVFGQSISTSRNFIEIDENGMVKLTALEGGGKVTGDHDGISFYYTVLDATADNFEISAEIYVLNYAKNPHDGQESFGIMVRDAIGTNRNSSVFASNLAAIGGYAGGTNRPNGIQLFARTGVESSDGAGSQGIQSVMLEEGRPLGNYKLTLKKTNSGFVGSIDDGEEAIIYEPEILHMQDDKMYVGFYVARLATIEVSDIELTVTKAATDAPRVNPPQEAVTPSFAVTSLNRTSLADYQLRLQPNVAGTYLVRQGDTTIASDIYVAAGEEYAVDTILSNGFTNFSITFIPDDTQFLTSYDRIVQNFTVEQRVYEGDIVVSPNGSPNGEGTIESPLDVDTAIDFVLPGQKIIVQEGTYLRSSPLDIKKHNNGTADAMKYLVAAEGARPIFDFDLKTAGGILSGDYWHIEGLDFTRSAGNTRGFTVGGSYNIIENSRFYRNGDTGLQISRTDQSNNIEDWPSYNLMLNVTSFENRDPSANNADGFAAKLTSGEGNVFDGAIAYHNIDDGWDLYTKVGSGKIGAVTIRNSIAFNNGFIPGDDVTGDGNGFKLGGEGVHVPHVIENSLAFGNLTYGFTSNSNPGVIARNNIGFNNGSGNISFTTYAHIPTDFVIDGFVSYHKAAADTISPRDQYPAALEAVNNFFFDGTVSRNIDGVVLTDENFVSLDYTAFERDEEGNIIWGDFLRFISPVEEEPTEPTDPENPVDPEDPTNPEKPTAPTEPGDSEEPAVPGEDDTDEDEDTEDEEDKEDKKEEKLPESGITQGFAGVLGMLFMGTGLVMLTVMKKIGLKRK